MIKESNKSATIEALLSGLQESINAQDERTKVSYRIKNKAEAMPGAPERALRKEFLGSLQETLVNRYEDAQEKDSRPIIFKPADFQEALQDTMLITMQKNASQGTAKVFAALLNTADTAVRIFNEARGVETTQADLDATRKQSRKYVEEMWKGSTAMPAAGAETFGTGNGSKLARTDVIRTR